jgi:plastocyanin
MLAPAIKVSGTGRSYNAGTKTLTLCKGDSANFHWAGGLPHDVAKVSAANYASCTVAGATNVAPLGTSGSKKVKFSAAGTLSYTCTVPGHCTR